MIELKSLRKVYDSFTAVDNLSLSVKEGEIFGFLGPNGAGKTSTIRMMMGILIPTSGTVFIDGLDGTKDRVKINRLVGYLPDYPIFYDFLKGREVLQFVAEMHGQNAKTAHENSMRLLNQFSLVDASEEYAMNYSLGMKKKLGLACALIHNPRVLILDEPTNGLDPRSSKDIQQHLTQFALNGGTVFISTHLLDMAEKLCHRIGVINRGSLLASGSIDEIRSSLSASGTLEDLFLKLTDDVEQTSV